jgi:hypothetical protein
MYDTIVCGASDRADKRVLFVAFTLVVKVEKSSSQPYYEPSLSKSVFTRSVQFGLRSSTRPVLTDCHGRRDEKTTD